MAFWERLPQPVPSEPVLSGRCSCDRLAGGSAAALVALEPTMQKLHLAGVELYFDDLPRARAFYKDVLGLEITDETPSQYAKFDGGACFICAERKGSESYPSQHKAVLFFEVQDLAAALESLGPERVVQSGESKSGRPSWAVIHDPEGHNILLLQRD